METFGKTHETYTPLSQLFTKIARVLGHSYFKVTKSMQMPEVMSIHIFQGSQRNYIHILPQGSQKFTITEETRKCNNANF